MRMWKLLEKMPAPVRYYFIRRIFTFSYELPEDITFKVAESSEEMEQAFRIIHDGYVERQIIKEESSKMRITKYFALPTTTMIICKHNNQVIATCSVIQDSKFGLPTDEYRDLDQFRKKDMKLVEVSGLAIAKSWRHQKGQLMIPLSKYMWEYVYHCIKADAIVISTAPFAKDFYRGLFLFDALDGDKVSDMKCSKVAKAVSQILFMKPFLERLEKTYKNVPKERSLWALSNHVYPNFKYPERQYHFTSDPVMVPKDLQYFFKEKTSLLEQLTEEEKKYLAEMYYYDDFKKVINNSSDQTSNRKSMRAPVACKAKAINLTNAHISLVGEVREISRAGMKLVIPKNNIEIGHDLNLEVLLNEFKKVSVKVKVKWKSNSEIGLELVERNSIWENFYNAAESRFPVEAMRMSRIS